MCCEQVEWNFKHLTLTKFQKSDKQRPELKDKPTPNFIDSEDARAKSMHQVITEEMFPRRKGDLHADKKHQSSGKDKKPKSPGKDKKNSEKGADPSNKIDMADLQVSFWVWIFVVLIIICDYNLPPRIPELQPQRQGINNCKSKDSSIKIGSTLEQEQWQKANGQ